MVEIAGSRGPMLVFQPWSGRDIEEAVERLPTVTGNGREFTAELEDFCMTFRPTVSEIRRVIKKKLKASDASTLRPYPNLNFA